MGIAAYPAYDAYQPTDAEWLEKAPAHWQTKRLKHISRQSNAKTSSKDAPCRYLGMENIESWTGRMIDGSAEVDGLANVFDAGDILFGKLRPYLAKVAKPAFDGICSSEFIVIKLGLEASADFVAYLLRSAGFVYYVNASTYGSKMPRANPSFVANAHVVLPPLPEQRAIAAFLDGKCAGVEEAVRIKQAQIALLRERRQILIQHAVTRGLNPAAPMEDSGIDWIGQIPAHWEVRRSKFVFAQRKELARKDDVQLSATQSTA